MPSHNSDLIEGSRISGYIIRRIVELKDINSVFYELVHTATGAKHVHVLNDDKENTFSVAFKTVPFDSTGVAHILEHTVLCGSNKFPVRDPFFAMLKRSLSTFMNAFTSSDWTMYPFASQNKKDFYNLMDVYLDAVFFPKLDPLSFKQEGHRLEIEKNLQESDSFKLVYKGVVYNEMKGAMSSPDQVMARSLLNALYPSTTYRHNSGGDPVEIPNLTYEQLTAFHRRHYHPSNAFFYTYGNLPLREHLIYIHEKILNKFSRINPETEVPSQPRWLSSKEAVYRYPIDKNEDPSKKCQACVAWLTADIKDSFEILVLTLLEQILLGHSASPLRKALIDSGLGTALSDSTGFDADNRDTLFACGLKDVKESAAAEIESIIFDVLQSLVDKGIDKRLIEAAIHQIEFHRKEVTNHPYPYGIKLLLFFGGSWFHGGDPARMLQFNDDFKRLDCELSEGRFFESRLKKYFLDNPHRVLLKLLPDPMMAEKENMRMDRKLAQIQVSLTPADVDNIYADMDALKKLQETDEDLKCLPTLELEDIPPLIQTVKETNLFSEASITGYSQPTSGIFYFTAAAGVGMLPKNLLQLVPFFCHALSRMGTTVRDYTEMAQLIAAYTGGLGLSAHARTRFEQTISCVPFITFNAKCLVRNLDRMFDIIEEFICRFDFSDLIRLKNLLLEYRAGLETMIVHNGHRLAISLASRNFSSTCALSEIWHGVHQLQFIKQISTDLSDRKLNSIAGNLTSIGRYIFTKHNLKMALIGEDAPLSKASSSSAAILKAIEEGMVEKKSVDGFGPLQIDTSDKILREGWSTSSAVSFTARAFQTVRMQHNDAPALSVIGKLIRSMYLHREIREKGGAYGGFSLYNSEDGLFCFASYRDPHIVTTLNAYSGAVDFIRSGKYGAEDIKEAILQVCSEIDKPDSPGAAARKAFYRKIILLSDEARSRFKQQLLGLNYQQVLEVAKKYFDPMGEKQAVAVVSSEEKLKAANQKMAGDPLELYRI
ncbi:MAG: insulinase family protein [Desulfobacterales bacterium]|nr:insulinase family protein [Desulfobacterales bacterium]